MFCPKCGNQMQDGANFCTSCGLQNPYAQVMNPQPSMQPNIQQQPTMQQPQQQYQQLPPEYMYGANVQPTHYADTSFKCAIWGLILFLCGVGFLAQPFALIFGILALRNHEPESAKAWIGTIIGIIGTAILALIILAMIRDPSIRLSGE